MAKTVAKASDAQLAALAKQMNTAERDEMSLDVITRVALESRESRLVISKKRLVFEKGVLVRVDDLPTERTDQIVGVVG